VQVGSGLPEPTAVGGEHLPRQPRGRTGPERFLATTAFRDTYLAAYRELYQRLYVDGAALRALDDAVAAATAAGATVSVDQVAALRSIIGNRTTALAVNRDVAG
jgi:spore coat protein CotH